MLYLNKEIKGENKIMNYQDFEFRTDYQTDTNVFTYRNKAGYDCEVNVKQYLPVSDKLDLIQIAFQKAE